MLDAKEGEILKQEGIARVCRTNQEFLEEAREVARQAIQIRGPVTMDIVRAVCEQLGIVPNHPNAWGGVFRHEDFVPTGEMHHSKQPQRHRNLLREWTLA